MKKITKYQVAAPLFVAASLILQATTILPAYAASAVSWTGSGDGVTFSDAANWSGNAVPVNGDSVSFDISGLSAQKTLNDDIAGLSLAGVTFTGNAAQYYGYTITGNALTLTGPVSNTITGTNADYITPSIENDITLGADVTVSKVTLGATDGTSNLTLGAYALTLSGSLGCGSSVWDKVSGSGAINVSGQSINLRGNNATYSGTITVTGNAAVAPEALGTAAGGTVVSGAGQLAVVNGSDATSSEPFTLGGTGSFSSTQGYFGCAGSSSPAVTLTLNGGVTLTSDFSYAGYNNLVVNNPYTPNGHTFSVAGGVNGTLTTPQGEQAAPVETIQLNGDSSTYVSLGKNQTGVLNGTRDGIGVGDGATLKGTGTANTVYVSDGGTIAPGNSPGTLTVLNEYDQSGTYNAEILNSGSYDKLVVGKNFSGGTNAVNLYSGAKLNVSLYSGWSVKKGDSFTIIDNQSATPVQGTFSGLAEGAQFTVQGITFNISYVGGDGNDVVLTALSTGTDPNAPNTGAMRLVLANPAMVAVLGAITAGTLGALAIRRGRKQN